jgi:hypothetical protein
MPAMIKDKYGNAIYEGESGYANALAEQNKVLQQLDTKLSSTPQQPLQNVSTPTIQPTPLGAYTAPSINSTDKVATTLLSEDKQEPSIWDKVRNDYLTPIGEGIGKSTKYLGDVGQSLYEDAKETASDVGNWADRNRVGLGGFATAIGAGLARRDPSEALANYNKSIIQNKQQRQEEEKFKMATDGNHPYNQQFRELFAKMLPDVTAKLGERFNSMTVQNFKDAGLTDLLDVTQKQMEISKNDPSSAISQRTRDMVSSQYGIEIPKNVSANEVPRFIEAYNTKLKQGVELKKLDLKKGELEVKGGKAFADIENQEMLTKLKQEENARQAQLFPSQLEEQKVKAKVATETQQYQIDTMKDKQKQLDLSNKSNDPNTKEAILARKNLEKRFPLLKKLIPPNMTLAQEADVVKGIEDFRLKAKGLTDRRAMASELRNAQLNIASMNDRTKRLGLQQTQEYRNQMIDLKKQQNERENLKLAYQNPMGTIPQKQLDAAGISKKDLSDTVEYSSDVQNAKDLVNEFKDILNRNGRFKILSDAEIRGKLQTMRTRFAGIIKRKDVLGALDAGVLTYVDQLLADPTSFSNALKPNSQMISQANTFLNGLENEEKNYYLGRKFDPRVARDIGQFQILVRKAGQGDKEAYKKLRDTGYSQDQINDFYQKRFNVIGDEEE